MNPQSYFYNCSPEYIGSIDLDLHDLMVTIIKKLPTLCKTGLKLAREWVHKKQDTALEPLGLWEVMWRSRRAVWGPL